MMTEITLSIEDGDRVNLYHPSFEKKLSKITHELDLALEDPFNVTPDGIIDDILGMFQDLGIHFD
jgi:PleD family two-component response regulator